MAEGEVAENRIVCGLCHQGKEREKECGRLYTRSRKTYKIAAHKMCMVRLFMCLFITLLELQELENFRFYTVAKRVSS